MADDERIVLEIDAPGLHANSVDTNALLALARTYFEGLAKFATLQKATFEAHGFEVVEKCVEMRAQTQTIGIAQLATSALLAAASGDAPAPSQMRGLVNELRQARRAFGSEAIVTARVGLARYVLKDTPDESKNARLTVDELRGRVTAVFGGTTPHIRIHTADRDIGLLNIVTTNDRARELGQLIDKLVDVTVELDWVDADIMKAALLSFRVVSESADAYVAWRDWALRNFVDVGGDDDDEVVIGRL